VATTEKAVEFCSINLLVYSLVGKFPRNTLHRFYLL
jgi:hypothetical protein